MATQRQLDEVTAGSEERLRTEPRARRASFDASRNLITVDLLQGYSISFSPQRSQVLEHATPGQLAQIEVDYPGFSIFFPLLDDGLLVGQMLQGRFGNDRWEAAWAASHQPGVAA